jgi:hypothetical protein
VLFSKRDLAGFINDSFEPAWESVRPVPIVRIDFGNGTTLTRTLHGNIATYVCTADGQVLDILPGIYEPRTYMERLDQFRLLARYVAQERPEKREARLIDFHRDQAEALKKNELPAMLVLRKRDIAPVTKRAIERPLEAVLVPGAIAKKSKTFPEKSKPAKEDTLSFAEDPSPRVATRGLAWKLLAEDTRINETVRGMQIHDMLAKVGLVRPQAIARALYKEVLHADLDDPYLGLGETLFANYPFAREDSGRQ